MPKPPSDDSPADSPTDSPTTEDKAINGSPSPSGSVPPESESADSDLGPADRVQWFGRPDAGEKPLGFWRLVVITLSSHIGVRSRARRHEDFRRANGLHVFIAGVVYFFLVIGALIVLTNFIASR